MKFSQIIWAKRNDIINIMIVVILAAGVVFNNGTAVMILSSVAFAFVAITDRAYQEILPDGTVLPVSKLAYAWHYSVVLICSALSVLTAYIAYL